ncbi:MAG: dihydroorotase [Gammaproteobacteria bacterium]|nr:dihydroorotase [Gammaproteobacteria bacterium]
MSLPEIEIPCPDDWHLHLRDADMLGAVLADTAAAFARAIVMPNLKPPVTTAAMAVAYRERIRAALPTASAFEPLMTCYLTDNTDPGDLAAGARDGVFTAAKLYPAGATTNSDAGVTDVARLDPVLAAMSAAGLPLLVHGEVVDDTVDIFDREAVFIERVLEPLRRRHPGLRVVLEHVTTAEAVAYVRGADPARLAATITPHHLVINRNALFAGGIRPHVYCLPVAKRERHRLALVEAACSGDVHFFLGTDSAPHTVAAKENACGCAGIYNSVTALATYLAVFEAAGALGHFEAFACRNGPAFYGLPVNARRVRFGRGAAWQPPAQRATGAGPVQVFAPPLELCWQQVAG